MTPRQRVARDAANADCLAQMHRPVYLQRAQWHADALRDLSTGAAAAVLVLIVCGIAAALFFSRT